MENNQLLSKSKLIDKLPFYITPYANQFDGSVPISKEYFNQINKEIEENLNDLMNDNFSETKLYQKIITRFNVVKYDNAVAYLYKEKTIDGVFRSALYNSYVLNWTFSKDNDGVVFMRRPSYPKKQIGNLYFERASDFDDKVWLTDEDYFEYHNNIEQDQKNSTPTYYKYNTYITLKKLRKLDKIESDEHLYFDEHFEILLEKLHNKVKNQIKQYFSNYFIADLCNIIMEYFEYIEHDNSYVLRYKN